MPAGFTVVEVLVALLVVLIGVLGILSLQIRSLHASHEAYLISIANVQAMDLEERIRVNRSAADAYAAGDLNVESSDLPASNCRHRACAPDELANYDLRQWLSRTKSLLPASLDVVLTEPGPESFKLELVWTGPDREYGDAKRRLIYQFHLIGGA